MPLKRFTEHDSPGMMKRMESRSWRLYLYAAAFCTTLLVPYLLPSLGPADAPVKNGHLDWTKATEPTLPLAGEWQALDRQLAFDDWGGASLEQLPAAWKNPFSFASYRLTISGLDPRRSYSLLIPYEATAYALYIDKALAAGNGQVGTTHGTSIPGYRPTTVTFRPGAEECELIVHVSNFHHRRGGLFQTIYFGEPDAVAATDLKHVVPDWALLFTYLTIGFYQLAFFAVRKDRPILFLAFFFVLAGFNTFLNTPNVLIFRVWPDFSWFAYQKLCYFTPYLTPLCLLLFTNSLYGNLSRRRLLFFSLPAFAVIVFVSLTPPHFFSLFNPVFQFYALFILGLSFGQIVEAVRSRTTGALAMLIGFGILSLFTNSAILFINNRLTEGTNLPLFFLNGRRIELIKSMPIPAITLSYILILLFVTLFSVAYFIRHPSILHRAVEVSAPSFAERARLSGLSARETVVARLIIEGKSNQEIAETLFISLSTVKTHISRIFRKADVRTRAELFFRFSPYSGAEPPESNGPAV